VADSARWRDSDSDFAHLPLHRIYSFGVSVVDFYDELALEYHLVYNDWYAAIERQGAALDRLIRNRLANAHDVLDCSCGIGTQSLGLASLRYRVKGTDISERSLDRARLEAVRLGLEISFARCDFGDLGPVEGSFDVVISCDNAIPHLLTEDDVARVFRAMRSKLRPGGLLIITVRDYDKELVERPVTTTPQINPGPPRQVLVRLHDWDAPDSPMYTIHLLVLTEGPAGWKVSHHSTRYRAIGREALNVAAEQAGFTQVRWNEGNDVGFHQPVMTALREVNKSRNDP
jgi:glycine/sarcosine N-methyltransferase